MGFTGSRGGMPQRQKDVVRYLLTEMQITRLHHGDCIGADSDVHKLALDGYPSAYGQNLSCLLRATRPDISSSCLAYDPY